MGAVGPLPTDPISPYAKHVTEPVVYKYWAIGLMTTSVVIGAVAALALANYASATPPVPALQGTTLGRALIGVSIAGNIVFGIAAGICAKQFKKDLSEEDEARLERMRVLKRLCETGEPYEINFELGQLRANIKRNLKDTCDLGHGIYFQADGISNIHYGDLLPTSEGTIDPVRLAAVRQDLADYYQLSKALEKRSSI
jgi:hypothetical protein